MNKVSGNDQAFPCWGENTGMTQRQWYAGQALSAVAARRGYAEPKGIIEDAFKIADAMIEYENQEK